jgi:hypothetical protein
VESEWAFFSVDVELTNVCGENCRMCPRESLRRPSGFMAEEVFERVLALAARFSSRITFSGFGNPALHPRWGECINRVRAAALPAGLVLHPGALDGETLSGLRRHPPTHVEISFPSTDPRWFARLCPNSEFVSAVERVETLRQLNVAPLVCVGLEMPGRPDSAKEYRDFWKRRGIRSRIFPCHSRGGHLSDRDLLRAKPVHCLSCGLLAAHGFIAWNGEVLACCHDLNGTTRFGSVVDDSPEDLAGRKAGHARDLPWEMCRNCDEFRKGWPLPTGPCPQSSGERGRYLAGLTKKGGSA